MVFGRSLAISRVVLTGASSGIGWELARELARHHARLVLASRNQERVTALADAIRKDGGEAIAVPTDLTDAAQRTRLVETAVAAQGGIDVLVNNAGVGAMGFFLDAAEEHLRRIFEVNFFACTELTRLALPYLCQGNGPMIVNISSVLGRRAIPGASEYCASKFALVGWSESLRAELFPHGVHVLVVCPGTIRTEFGQNLLADRVRYGWQKGPAFTADRCARNIVRAMRRRRNEVVITPLAKLMVGLNRLVPRLVDFVMARFVRPVS